MRAHTFTEEGPDLEVVLVGREEVSDLLVIDFEELHLAPAGGGEGSAGDMSQNTLQTCHELVPLAASGQRLETQ